MIRLLGICVSELYKCFRKYRFFFLAPLLFSDIGSWKSLIFQHNCSYLSSLKYLLQDAVTCFSCENYRETLAIQDSLSRAIGYIPYQGTADGETALLSNLVNENSFHRLITLLLFASCNSSLNLCSILKRYPTDCVMLSF